MGEERNVYKVLVGKPEGKSPLGRPRRGWENGIRMDIRESGFSWLMIEASCEYAMNLRALAPRSELAP
jgi:hypothetical protein